MKVKIIVGSVLLGASMLVLAGAVVGNGRGATQAEACSAAQENAATKGGGPYSEVTQMGQCVCNKGENNALWFCTVNAMTRDKK